MKTETPGGAGRERWNLWKLQALLPEATPAVLAGIRRQAAEFNAIEDAVLRRGQGDLNALMREARRFMAERPELHTGLILTMHMGPYALLPAAYLLADIVPVVVLDRSAYDRIRPRADQQQRQLGLSLEVEWITTDGVNFVTRMIRALRDRRPVVVYLDGNRGVGGMEATREHGMPYGLPGRTIRLRTGLGRLISRGGYAAHCVNVRWRKDGSLDWRSAGIGASTAQAGAMEVTRRLYDWLFAEVVETPWQWTFWEMLGQASDCFAEDRLAAPEPADLVERSDLFHEALERRAGYTRVLLNKTVEIWQGDLLVDLSDQHFYSAEGLRDEALEFLRWGREPTLATMIDDCGESWVRRHLLRLFLLDLVVLKAVS